MKATILLCVSILVAGNAGAGTKVYVALAGVDDDIPKLGRPSVAITVEAMTQGEAILVSNELQRELGRVVHTRPLDLEEAGDYRLKVNLDLASLDKAVSTVPFTATLASGRGDRLWRIDGRAETTEAPFDPTVMAAIGRNVVSALVHDGWLTPRYDPDDPPPAAPQLRKDDSAD